MGAYLFEFIEFLGVRSIWAAYYTSTPLDTNAFHATELSTLARNNLGTISYPVCDLLIANFGDIDNRGRETAPTRYGARHQYAAGDSILWERSPDRDLRGHRQSRSETAPTGNVARHRLAHLD